MLSYAVLVQFAPLLDALDGARHVNTAFHLLVGAIFGAFVLAPYARSPRRLARGIALAVAAAGIYYAAIRFVVAGPASFSALAAFTTAGAAAALLSGLAVALVAPRGFTLRLAAFLLVAGAAGGVTFALRTTFDQDLLIGHAAWQLLTCMALFLGRPGGQT